jgi:hypothetical protein
VGSFEGNDLVLPADMKEEKLTVRAVLRANPALARETIIWIKKLPEPDQLPAADEIIRQKTKSKRG